MGTPRAVPLADADQVFNLPSGVAGAWLRTGVIRPIWFVHHGTIVQGVLVLDMRQLCQQRRLWHLRRAAAGRQVAR